MNDDIEAIAADLEIAPSRSGATPSEPVHVPRTRSVAVVGLGYVGLPLAAAYLRAGLRTVGVDHDPALVDTLRAGRTPHPHLDPESWRVGQPGGLEPVTDLARVAECDAVSLCLPTPADADGRPELEPLRRAASALAEVLVAGQLVLLHSTVYPGFTRDELIPLLESGGLRVGRDLFVAYSPEREDPGRGLGTHAVARLVGGACEVARERAVDLLESAVERVHPTVDIETAEAAKLHENVYRAVNIALVTELAEVYRKLGLDPHAVVDAAATKPYGFEAFRPGPGPGGHCIPVDPRYLLWAAGRVEATSPLLERSLEVNAAEPSRWVNRAIDTLEGLGRSVEGAEVLVLGLAYKAGVGDLRESPGLAIASGLLERGCRVLFADPHIDPLSPEVRLLRDLGEGLAGPVSAEPGALSRALERADLALLLVDHPEFDLRALKGSRAPILDPRGVLRGG